MEPAQVIQEVQALNHRSGYSKLQKALVSIDQAIQFLSSKGNEELHRTGELGTLAELRALRLQTEHNISHAERLRESGKAFFNNYKAMKQTKQQAGENVNRQIISQPMRPQPPQQPAPAPPQPAPAVQRPPAAAPAQNTSQNTSQITRELAIYKEQVVSQEKELLRLRNRIEDQKLIETDLRNQAKKAQENWSTHLDKVIAEHQSELVERQKLLETRESEIESMSAMSDQMHERIRSLETENARVDTAADTMTRISQETDTLRIEKERMSITIDRLQHEKNDVYNELNATKSELTRVKAEYEAQASQNKRTTPRTPKSSGDNSAQLLGQVKDLTQHCNSLMKQIRIEDPAKTREAQKVLQEKITKILRLLNPVSQVMYKAEDSAPSLANNETIKKMLKQRKKLIVINDSLEEQVKNLQSSQAHWHSQFGREKEEKSIMLGKLKETLCLQLAEKERIEKERNEFQEAAYDLRESLDLMREQFRRQEAELLKYQNNFENFEKVKQVSQVVNEATTIQSIAIQKDNAKLKKEVEEYQDRIQAMLTDKEGLTRQIRKYVELIDELKLEKTRTDLRLKALEKNPEEGTYFDEGSYEELQATVQTLTEQNEAIRKEKYMLQRQVDEVDDKLNNMHMIICDLENQKRELGTQNELLKKTAQSGYRLPQIDPTDPRIQSRLDQFGLLPPKQSPTVFEGILEFLFPFLFEDDPV